MMQERERSLLSRLGKELAGDFAELSLFLAEELGTQMDVLRILETGYGSAQTEALGEFFFRPAGDAGLLLFSAMVTLTNGLVKKYAPLLAYGISKLNFYLPCGGFAIDAQETTLVYRLSQACDASMEDGQLLRQMRDCISMAFAVPEQYAGMLLKMAEGGVSMKELSVLFPEV